MPLRGGHADKVGNRYEYRWVVSCMLEIMEGRADSIHLEKPGEKGFEFLLKRGGVQEFHQVKRQHGQQGTWSIPSLHAEGVLEDFFLKLVGADVKCMFVSMHSAWQIEELSDRARKSTSYDVFNTDYLKDNENATRFDQLLQKLNGETAISRENVFERLKRIQIETISEETLRRQTERILISSLDGDYNNAYDALTSFASENLLKVLTAHDILSYLEERNIHRQKLSDDQNLWQAVKDQNERYLRTLEDCNIGGQVIPREEAQEISDFIKDSELKKLMMVSGSAGAGKSGVLREVINRLKEDKTVYLALRADQYGEYTTPEIIGESFSRRKISPVYILQELAQGKPCVFLIDQLDAVSLVSGRNVTSFDCIREMVAQAGLCEKMRVILACRKFDLENDHRFRKFTKDEKTSKLVEVGPLSQEIVERTLEDLGLTTSAFTKKQLDLLQLPLHLNLLSEIAHDPSSDASRFETVIDLFDQYWKYKEREIIKKGNGNIAFGEPLETLANHMTENQTLLAPESVLSNFTGAVDTLASEHVLVKTGRQISFFHESFFDYVYARVFVTKNTGLRDFLLEGEQALFRRAQVRQILSYERSADNRKYLQDLNDIITSTNIRFHLRHTTLRFLSQQTSPKKEELDILLLLLESTEERLVEHVWDVFAGEPCWFDLLDGEGLLEKWLKDISPDSHRLLMDFLRGKWQVRSERVTELLEPKINVSLEWNNEICNLLWHHHFPKGERFFLFFMRFINETDYLEGENDKSFIQQRFWAYVKKLASINIDWACKAIKTFLDWHLGRLPHSYTDNVLRYFLQGDHDEMNTAFSEVVSKAPQMYLKNTLPFILDVLQRVGSEDKIPYHWRHTQFEELGHDPLNNRLLFIHADDVLIYWTCRAAERLAERTPDDFSRICADFKIEESPHRSIQCILLMAWAKNGLHYSNHAMKHMLNQPDCLAIGSSAWVSRCLIEAISPYCDDSLFSELEKHLIDLYPESETSASSYQWRRRHEGKILVNPTSWGQTQFALLSAMSSKRLSPPGKKRLKEWQRKFKCKEPDPPDRAQGGYVGPPIPIDRTDKMKDEDWLGAISRYNKRGERNPRDFLKGGAEEQARVLENKCKEDPQRFLNLVERFPDDFEPCYGEAILRGVAGCDAIKDDHYPVEEILRVVKFFHARPNRPHGRDICYLVGKVSTKDLPEIILEIVAWYAVESENLTTQDDKAMENEEENPRLLDMGFGTVRGSAANTIHNLLANKKERLPFFKPYIEHMVEDPSTSVRAVVAGVLYSVMVIDREASIPLFTRLCNAPDALMATHWIERFLNYALVTHYTDLKPLLERMVSSKSSEVMRVGSKWTCFSELHNEDAATLVEACLGGTKSHRLGAAQLFADLGVYEDWRVQCESRLKVLFHDPEEEVRDAAGKVFWNLSRADNAYTDHRYNLVQEFIKSSAFVGNSEALIDILHKSTAKLPAITLDVCKCFVSAILEDPNSRNSRGFYASDEVSRLLVRLYGQYRNSTDKVELRNQCLDLVDRLVWLKSFEINKTLEEMER